LAVDGTAVPLLPVARRLDAPLPGSRLGPWSSQRRPRYRRALFHLLAAETGCYRYWGQGVWTDYGAELARRVADILTQF
jgi:hypothetical protein